MNHIPAVRDRINKELKDIDSTFAKEALERMKTVPFILKLPNDGLESNEILERVKECVELGKGSDD